MNYIDVEVKLVGNLRKYGDHINNLKVPEGTTVRDFFERFGLPIDEDLAIIVNGKPKYIDYEVEDGDKIDILRPIPGE